MAHKKNGFVKLCENTGLGSGWRGENCIVEQATHSVAFDQCWLGRRKAQGRRLFRNFHNSLTVRRGSEFVFHFSTLWKWMWQMEIKVKTKTQTFATGQLRRKEWPGGVGQRRRWWWMWVLAQIGFSAGNKVLEGILAITIMPNNRGQYCARFPTLISFCPLHNTLPRNPGSWVTGQCLVSGTWQGQGLHYEHLFTLPTSGLFLGPLSGGACEIQVDLFHLSWTNLVGFVLVLCY